MVPISGNPDPAAPKAPEELPAYMKKLHAIDLPRQTAIRARVAQVVKDSVTAKRLQAWYPTWCKRPCFHDEYLSSFNRDNVTLVDTDGKGPDGLTADSIVVGDDKYPVDIIIFATGFRNPYSGTPAEKANLTITGGNGLSMSQEWATRDPGTLHGVLDYNFPNLFLSGPWQASASPNFLFNVDELGKHSAYILKEAKLRAAGKPFAVAATKAAAEEWAMQVMMRGVCGAAIIGCTPGYFNLEGEIDLIPVEGQVRMARSGLWGLGIESYLEHIEAWRAEGNIRGIEVRT
jgi:cation diffusion facilitator CzcD-associated flavoprotein CzcO